MRYNLVILLSSVGVFLGEPTAVEVSWADLWNEALIVEM